VGNLVNSGFSKLSSVNFIAQTERIITAMSGNANFPEPWPSTVPSLARLQADLAALQTASTATASGDKTQIAARKSARSIVQNDLAQLAFYVQTIAQGSTTMLATTGFPLRQVAQRTLNPPLPPAPAEIVSLRGPLSGSIIVNASRVPKAASYEVQLATADPTVENNWSEAGTWKTSKVYSFRMRAFAKAGFGPWATAASLMVV